MSTPTGRIVVSTRETALKTKNLRRDSRVSLCVLSTASTGTGSRSTAPPRSCRCPTRWSRSSTTTARSAGEHPDWDDYRAAMVREQRVMRADHPGPCRSGPLRLTHRRRDPRRRSRARLGGERRSPCSRGGADRWWRGRSTPHARRVCTRCCSSSATGSRGAGRVDPRPRRGGGRATRTGPRGSRRACGPRSTRSTPLTAVDAVCIGLADQPLVGSAAYRLRRHGRRREIAVPRYDGSAGQSGQAVA